MNIVEYKNIVFTIGAVCLLLRGLIPGMIAHAKSRSFIKYYLFGAVFFIPTMIFALVADEKAYKDSPPFAFTRVMLYGVVTAALTYVVIKSSDNWFIVDNYEVDVSMILLGIVIILIVVFASSVAGTAVVYALRKPVSGLINGNGKKASGQAGRGYQTDDYLCVGKESLFDKILDFLIFILSAGLVVKSNRENREHRDNIYKAYGVRSHTDTGDPHEEGYVESKNFVDTKKQLLRDLLDRDGVIRLSDNRPCFSDDEKRLREKFFRYRPADSLNRCMGGFALLDETCHYPNTGRDDLQRKAALPSGFRSEERYDFLKDEQNTDGHLYERCHLIAYRYCGDENNDLNMITGTCELNRNMMNLFESESSDIVRALKNGLHVLYRVTPFYNMIDLVPKGVEIEAYSVEDNGKAVCQHVFILNKQPGVSIDYLDGRSRRSKI